MEATKKTTTRAAAKVEKAAAVVAKPKVVPVVPVVPVPVVPVEPEPVVQVSICVCPQLAAIGQLTARCFGSHQSTPLFQAAPEPASPTPMETSGCEPADLCEAFSTVILDTAVRDVDAEDYDNPMLCSEYVKKIYTYLREVEVKPFFLCSVQTSHACDSPSPASLETMFLLSPD